MNVNGFQFELSRDIERHLAALSKLYGAEGQQQKQELIVNARVRVVEEWTVDNWNGGTYGHAVYFTVPAELYLACARNKEDIQTEIKSDLNKIHNVENEFIAAIFLEMEVERNEDWRGQSGLVLPRRRSVNSDALHRIWTPGKYRLFISHRSEVKREATALKAGLGVFGMSSFVAHEDVQPTREWQDEIENALGSMDAFVALMTADFHESLWTDQEVGFAICRRVPVIALRLGCDPYGFIAKFQALSCDIHQAPVQIARLLTKDPRMRDAYLHAIEDCKSFDDANTLAELLPAFDEFGSTERERIVAAFNANPQISGSFGFNGSYPQKYGRGIAFHLRRTTGREYIVESDVLKTKS